MIATNNHVDISFTNENDDEPPTNKAFLDDGEHTKPFLMFKQLN